MKKKYRPGKYRHFYIYEPKKRRISAAPYRDRIVHHALVNTLEPIFEPKFIYDSYACRKGKGTHRAIERSQKFLRRHKYVLKTDIVKFFPCIDHKILIDRLARYVRDPNVRWLISSILASGEHVHDGETIPTYFSGDDLFAVLRPRGLPIGNLTSQFFANAFLDPIDHFIKEELRISAYVRYADDLLLFANDKKELTYALFELRQRLSIHRLRLHPNKTHIIPSSAGVKYLGFRIWPYAKKLQQDSLRRFNQRLRNQKWLFKTRRMNFAEIRRSLKAWQAHANTASSNVVVQAALRRAHFRRSSCGHSTR